MTGLTPSQLQTIRQRPQSTKVDLFIFNPSVIFTAQVNDLDIAKGEMTISYNNSSGTFSDVREGMTLLVGSTYGGYDVGKARIRSIEGGYMVISENSDIDWKYGQHLTVLKYWQVFPVFPRAIQNPLSTTDVIFYKDYDIVYEGQNSSLGTFVNAGSHQPVLIVNATGTVFWTASGTHNLLDHDDWLQYSWFFEGATVTGSSLHTPGNIYYDTPGDYVTTLTVNASGTIDQTHRYVSVRNAIGEGNNTPIQRWTMNELTGSRAEGGYTVEITVYDQATITEESVIMLRSDNWYGGNNVSFGKLGQENIFFVGYVEKGSIRYAYDRSYFTFTAVSVTSIMKQATGFSVTVESKSLPYKWYELLDMDIRRAVYHYLKWHSTVLSVSDIEFRGTDQKIQFFDVDRTSVFDAVDNLMRSAVIGTLCADRTGKLWFEIEPKAYLSPTGTFTPIMTIEKGDWKGEPEITENIYGTSSYLELGGVAYSGSTTGTFSAHLSSAPGLTPSAVGSVDKMSGLAISSQEHINILAGNLWTDKNQRFPQISMDMTFNAQNIDIAPYEVVQINIQPEDTVRNVEINAPYIPSDVSFPYDAKNQIILPSVTFDGLVQGVPGDTLTIPPEDSGYTTPEYDTPDFPTDLTLDDYTFVTDPILTDPSLLYPCSNGTYSINQYNITWSKTTINGTDEDRTSKVYLPCVIHRAAPFGSTTVVRLNLTFGGDADWSMVHVYAFRSGNRVATAVGGVSGYEFLLTEPMEVDGFELELDAGAGSIATYTPKNVVSVGTVQASNSSGVDVPTEEGKFYSIEATGGPWNPTPVFPTWQFYNFYRGSFHSPLAGIGWEEQTMTLHLDIPPGCLYTEAVDSRRGRTYFYGDSTNIFNFCVSDNIYTDNSGSLGYILRNAEVIGRYITTSGGVVQNICPPGSVL